MLDHIGTPLHIGKDRTVLVRVHRTDKGRTVLIRDRIDTPRPHISTVTPYQYGGGRTNTGRDAPKGTDRNYSPRGAAAGLS